MSTVVTIGAGSMSSGASQSLARNTTPATDIDSAIPDLDGFVIAATRVPVRAQSGGVAIVISSKGVISEGDTYRATLTVVAAEQLDENEAAIPLSQPLVVCDYGAETPYNPEVSTVLRLSAEALPATAMPGELLQLVWNESGDIDDDGDSRRPEFMLLGWPFVAVEESSF